MSYNPPNPIIVQGDKSVLLEVDNDLYQDARDVLARFAELEKSPEYVHTYKLTPLSLWNAASSGLSAETLTLIEFRDQAALEELAAHPDLQACLIPFPTADRALVVVPAEKLPQVKGILTRFGVQVKEGL